MTKAVISRHKTGHARSNSTEKSFQPAVQTASGGRELPQNVMQDTSVAVILRLFGGIDAHPGLELLHFPVFSLCRYGDFT